MKKEEQQEKIQNRREFFKKAALGALPIIGGIVLASCNRGSSSLGDALEKSTTSLGNSMDVTAKENSSTEKVPMDCGYTCTGSCHGSCSSSCKNSCAGDCDGTCTGSCSSCRGTCKGDCNTTCEYYCRRTCSGSCAGTSSR